MTKPLILSEVEPTYDRGKNRKQPIVVKLEPELLNTIAAEAKRLRVSRGQVIRAALRKFFGL